MALDAVLLSRVQFFWVVALHILLPAFTVGLASYIAVLEALYLATRRPVYLRLSSFWLKAFAVSFGMGVVSGIVMSFQFGTNWSKFSIAAGNIVGPLLNYEVLTAFFLEATFLGVMLFGWRRVGHVTHFLATAAVALGTLISTFWIIAANSWMQTPAGYELRDGVFFPLDWFAVIFNPSFFTRLPHMGSVILTQEWNGEVKGLRDFPAEARPPVKPVFFAFRVMVGVGVLMLAMAIAGLLLWWRGRLFDARWFLRFCALMTPAGFIA